MGQISPRASDNDKNWKNRTIIFRRIELFDFGEFANDFFGVWTNGRFDYEKNFWIDDSSGKQLPSAMWEDSVALRVVSISI